MGDTIIVVSADEKQLAELRTILEGLDHQVVVSRSARGLAAIPGEHHSLVMILDVDTVPVDNRLLREVKHRNPSVHIVLISEGVFHPDLKEAMVSYIDVCLSKPVNPDELQFWLRSVFQDPENPRAGPNPGLATAAGRLQLHSDSHKRGDEEMSQ